MLLADGIVSEEVEGPAIYDLVENYITQEKMIAPKHSGMFASKDVGCFKYVIQQLRRPLAALKFIAKLCVFL